MQFDSMVQPENFECCETFKHHSVIHSVMTLLFAVWQSEERGDLDTPHLSFAGLEFQRILESCRSGQLRVGKHGVRDAVRVAQESGSARHRHILGCSGRCWVHRRGPACES